MDMCVDGYEVVHTSNGFFIYFILFQDSQRLKKKISTFLVDLPTYLAFPLALLYFTEVYFLVPAYLVN